ncbi:hypothetical protein AMTRI_Chr05g57020 [Amborella trichopoda]
METIEEERLLPGEEASELHKALQELKALRRHLHHAADYYELSFMKKNRSKIVILDAKEYIANSVVATLDHLGNLSSILESLLSDTSNHVSNTHLRIDCLKNRVLTCKEFSEREGLNEQRWAWRYARYYKSYECLDTGTLEDKNSDVIARENKDPTSGHISKRFTAMSTHSKSLDPSPLSDLSMDHELFSSQNQRRDGIKNKILGSLTWKNKKAI